MSNGSREWRHTLRYAAGGPSSKNCFHVMYRHWEEQLKRTDFVHGQFGEPLTIDERISHGDGFVPEDRCRRLQGLLPRSWAKECANDPPVTRLSHRRPHVPRSHSATRGPIPPRRSRPAGVWAVRHAGARRLHLHVREYHERVSEGRS